jgi:hypothetical protein
MPITAPRTPLFLRPPGHIFSSAGKSPASSTKKKPNGDLIMTTLVRAALVALALVGTASAASAVTYTNDNSLNWNADARSFFEQLQRDGN